MGQNGRHCGRWVFYYDGECGFCRRMAGGLSRLDVFGQIDWTPYQGLRNPPGGLSWGDLDGAAFLKTGGGTLYEGFYACRRLTLRLAALLPLAPVLWLPGVNRVGVATYGWVARNRYFLSRCRLPGSKVER